MKRKICILLYIATLYYLLPFRPLYLYATASIRHASIHKNLKLTKPHRVVYGPHSGTIVQWNKDLFPKKQRIKFFFVFLKLDEPVTSEVTFFIVKNTSPLFHIEHQNHILLIQCPRGPPVA